MPCDHILLSYYRDDSTPKPTYNLVCDECGWLLIRGATNEIQRPTTEGEDDRTMTHDA